MSLGSWSIFLGYSTKTELNSRGFETNKFQYGVNEYFSNYCPLPSIARLAMDCFWWGSLLALFNFRKAGNHDPSPYLPLTSLHLKNVVWSSMRFLARQSCRNTGNSRYILNPVQYILDCISSLALSTSRVPSCGTRHIHGSNIRR